MDTTPRAAKRGRSDSLSSNSSGSSTRSQASSSRSLSPVNKILRSTSIPGEAIECNLPPTCFPNSQKLETTAELERHQLAFHTYICRTPVRDKTASAQEGQNDPWAVPREFKSRQRNEWKECRKIFPDQRILDLVSLLSWCNSHFHPPAKVWTASLLCKSRPVTDISASSRDSRPKST